MSAVLHLHDGRPAPVPSAGEVARVETRVAVLREQHRDLVDLRTRIAEGFCGECDICGESFTELSKQFALGTVAGLLETVEIDLRWFASRLRQLELTQLDDADAPTNEYLPPVVDLAVDGLPAAER